MIETSLGATLRTWRERMPPAPTGGVRRAVGLRREELADRAGVSVDYIVRLEQGRATAPSGHVVAALARVLHLSSEEREHLYRLAGLSVPGERTICDVIGLGVQRVLTRLGDLAVGVFAADWQLIWWNRAWAALFGDPALVEPSARNFARHRFPVPGVHATMSAYPVRMSDAEVSDAAIVADLRRASAIYPDDRRLAAMIAQLVETNERFARMWRTGVVGAMLGDHKVVEHPLGDIAINCDTLYGEHDQKIVTMTVEPGSTDEQLLARALATI